jgi:lipopolysaccharide transport protein LptA
MRIFCLSILLVLFTFADRLIIGADKFTAKDNQKEIHFVGHANISQDGTSIKADNIVVYFGDDNSTKSFIAKGHVRFSIKNRKVNYNGRCNSIKYKPKKKLYILSGSVKLKDRIKNRSIVGEHISINTKNGSFTIKGKKSKQAKLIFNIK